MTPTNVPQQLIGDTVIGFEDEVFFFFFNFFLHMVLGILPRVNLQWDKLMSYGFTLLL